MRAIHHKILRAIAVSPQSIEGVFKSTNAAKTMKLKSFRARFFELVRQGNIEEGGKRYGYKIYRLAKIESAHKVNEKPAGKSNTFINLLKSFYGYVREYF